MINLGTISFLLFQYSVKLLLLPILMLINKIITTNPFYKIKSRKKFINSFRKSLFFGEILVIFLETYLELLIASVMNLQCVPLDQDCQVFNTIVSIMILSFALIVLPVAGAYVITKIYKTKNKNIPRPKFDTRWGAFYDSYRKKSLLALTYKVWFCLRRIIFVFSVFYNRDHLIWQMFYLLYVNLAMSIYIGVSRPYQNSTRNKIEMLNELQFSFICYLTVIFTDFVDTVEKQYKGGWIMIVFIMAFFLINMIIVLKTLINTAFLILVKYYN